MADESDYEDMRLLTVKEVAYIIGAQPRYVRNVLVAERGLPAVRLKGKTLRFRRDDVDEWIAQARRGLV